MKTRVKGGGYENWQQIIETLNCKRTTGKFN